MRKQNAILPLLGLTTLLLSSCAPAPEDPSSSFLPNSEPSSLSSLEETPSEENSVSCPPSQSASSQESSEAKSEEGSFSFGGSDPSSQGEITFEGAEDLSWPLNRYFDSFYNVKAKDENGRDVTSSLSVDGHVDFGKEGTYRLTYRLGDSLRQRNVRISKTAPIPSEERGSLPTPPSFRKGSLHAGEGEGVPVPNFAPSYMDARYQGKPIPTNKWWSCLASQNRGGLSGDHANSLYPGVYKASFQSGGFEFTDNGKGFVEYGKAGPSQNEDTASLHGNFFVDTLWKTPGLSSDYSTCLIDYSDGSIKVACRNERDGEDEMVATLTQGSPFAYLETKGNRVSGSFRSAGISKGYLFFDLDGNPVSKGQTCLGEACILVLQGSHAGYQTSPWGGIGAPVYRDSYFLLFGGQGSAFSPAHRNHADATMLDGIDVELGGNVLALAPLGREGDGLSDVLAEAKKLCKHAFSKVSSLSSSYRVDHLSGQVRTLFSAQVERIAGEEEPLLGLFPHQKKNSRAACLPYFHEGFRSKVHYLPASSFETILPFEGLLPSLPVAEDLDRAKMAGMLRKLDEENVPGKRHYDNSRNSYLNKSAPYWNAKSLYPLAMGLSLSEQMGEEALSSSFKDKLKEVLSDWLTYDPSLPIRNESLDEAGDRYFHYDGDYGALTFSDGEFNTASELSDHHFTHGYLIYAAAILSMYDPSFLKDFGDILDFEVRDIASCDREDPYFPYLRCFDPYMGHCWANGLGDFGDGNNEESEGEALSSWAACYLYGQVRGDLDLIDASIYGCVSELESAKTYWFDYEKEVWPDQIRESGIGVMAIQWGGKSDYATWFGANPSFIYGIEWLPIGTYLSGYAQNAKERIRLQEIYSLWEMAQKKSPTERTWRANFASVCSLFDPEKALGEFDEEAMREEDYPNEIPLAYAFATSNRSLGFRKSGARTLDPRISFSYYETGAYFYNPTDESITSSVYVDGKASTVLLAPHGYAKV